MNKTVEIISDICNYENKGHTLFEIFRKVFEENDPIELLKKRALIVEECERVIKEVDADENSLIDIYNVLSYNNLSTKLIDVKPALASKDASHAKILFSFHENIQRPHDVEDIIKVSDELKEEVANDEDVTEEQKLIIYEICDAVEDAKKEHIITGNNAIKKLYEILIGKTFLYRKELTSIKSTKIKQKLMKVYKKVEEVNKLMGYLISIKNNVSEFIGLLS